LVVITQGEISKGLIYRVETQADITKALAYEIKSSVELTKGLAYRVITEIIITKGLDYVLQVYPYSQKTGIYSSKDSPYTGFPRN